MSISSKAQSGRLDRMLTMEMARVVEAAAVAAARERGKGDEKKADQVAVDAMRTELNNLPMNGRIVIGEGERDEAPMLYIGEEVGYGGPDVDIALDPLEGTTICAKNQPNSLAVIAIAERGKLLYAPDVYMDKIAIGPGYPAGTINIDATPTENLNAVAKAKGVKVSEISTCVMDRPRHADLIAEIRAAGAPVRALRCTGGQMQGRLILDTEEKAARAAKMGVSDPNKAYTMEEMASGDVLFAATGVTDGNMLKGVRFANDGIYTHTVVMRSSSGTIRWIDGRHVDSSAKF